MPVKRFASSLIITRGKQDTLEVFLAQRNPELRFMGGYWAFPGGTVIPEDHDARTGSLDLAFTRCAIRELFEETGILTGNAGQYLNNRQRAELRKDLLNNSAVADWVKVMNDANPDLDRFCHICELTTPSFAPVVYNTRFFHIPVNEGDEPELIHGELVDSNFFSPAAAISKWEQGELFIAPPVVFLLKLMLDLGFSKFLKHADSYTRQFLQGKLHPVYFVPGIFMAPLKTPTLPPATTTNTLIIGHEKLFIVEPATPYEDEQQKLFAKIDEFLGAGKKFEAILLTHYHADHVGAVTATSRKYKLPVRAHVLTYDRIPGGYIKGKPLADGDRIELGFSPDGKPDWYLEVLHTPGHADDHICYLESRYRSIIAGDMLSTVSTILIDPPEGHMQTYLRSLKRLQEYPIKTLFPSHGPVHQEGSELISYFLAHRKERENRIVSNLKSSVQSIDDLLPQVYDDVDESTYPIAARSLLAGLIKLQEEGICQKHENGWSLTTV